MALASPLKGTLKITQNFGDDFKFTGKWNGKSYKDVWFNKTVLGAKGHNGIDYSVKTGTPVYAADDGTIVFEGWGQNNSWMGTGAGVCVLIKHSNCHTGYAHLNSTVINKNQKVKKGQLIGYSGNTGGSTGAHLHFEALPLKPDFKNGYGGRVDPAKYTEKKPVITTKQMTAVTAIEFNTERVLEPSLEVGVEIVSQEGKAGSRTVVTEHTYTDGKETSKKVISDKTVAAIDKIILVGTKEKNGNVAKGWLEGLIAFLTKLMETMFGEKK